MDEVIIADLEQKLADVHVLLMQEMEARAAADEELSRRMSAKLPPQGGDTTTVGPEECGWIKRQFEELNLLLEAEVDARFAVMQRLDQQVKDHQQICEDKFDKLQTSIDQSMQALSGAQNKAQSHGESAPFQALEQKVQRLLDGYSQKLESTNLQVETFRENVNAVAAEARKHIKWVETQHEKSNAKHDSFDNGLQEVKLRLSGSSSRHDAIEAGVQEVKSKIITFDAVLQDMRSKSSINSKKLTELEDGFSVVSEFFDLHSKMRSLASSATVDIQENVREVQSVLAMKEDGRHSEPPLRASQSRSLGENARASEPMSRQSHRYDSSAHRMQTPATSSGRQSSSPSSVFTFQPPSSSGRGTPQGSSHDLNQALVSQSVTRPPAFVAGSALGGALGGALTRVKGAPG